MKVNAAAIKVEAVLAEAFAMASEATNATIAENPNVWYPCGFAWVKISPARGPYVKALKEKGLGRTDSYEGGFSVWNPSGNPTQWMDAKYAGALAFAEVLRKNGVNCHACQRID